MGRTTESDEPRSLRRQIAPLSLVLIASGLAGACGDDGPNGVAPNGGGDESDVTTRRAGFVEVAEEIGIRFDMKFLPGEQGENFKINLYDHGSGVLVGDVDGDGHEDLYLLNQLGPNGLFRNRGDGTFEDVTERAGVALDDRICTSGSFADIDNDGDQDLFVASTRGGNVLFRNEGDGRFVDITAAAGVEYVGHSQGVAFFDYDDDGLLDLFVSNTAKWTLDTREPEGRYFVGQASLIELVQSDPELNALYHNEGDGTFRDVTEETGTAGRGWGGDIAIFDVDSDGDQDLFVTNMFGLSMLLRNDAGKRFTDVTEETLGRTSWGAVGCKPMDYDGDGLLDLFLVDMHSDMWMPVTSTADEMREKHKFGTVMGEMVERGKVSAKDLQMYEVEMSANPRKVLFGNTLFRNLGNGRYEETSEAANAETFWPWGIAAADFDLDGDEDAFLPAGMGYPFFYWRNALLMNAGDGTFAWGESAEGIEPRPGGPHLPDPIGGSPATRSSRCAAVMDIDEDGRPDLAVNNFNERAYVYRNQFPERHWVGLRLRGTKSNRDAVGALAHVHVGGGVQVRQVHAAGGYLAQSTRTLYFGLGDNDSIERCTIRWPSGIEQELTDLEIDRLHDIVEPVGERR